MLAWWLGRRIPERDVGGSILTRVTVFVSLSKTHLPPISTRNTQEAVAPSQREKTNVWHMRKQRRKSASQVTALHGNHASR